MKIAHHNPNFLLSKLRFWLSTHTTRFPEFDSQTDDNANKDDKLVVGEAFD